MTDVSPRPQVKGGLVTALDWHDELELMAELSSVNNQIARFVLRLLDVDAGRAQHLSVADQGRLGIRLVELGRAIQDHALHRAPGFTNNGMAIEVPGSFRKQIEPGRTMTTAGDKP
jgi:hypothetical protein